MLDEQSIRHRLHLIVTQLLGLCISLVLKVQLYRK